MIFVIVSCFSIWAAKSILDITFGKERCIPNSRIVSTNKVETFKSINAYHQKDKGSVILQEQNMVVIKLKTIFGELLMHKNVKNENAGISHHIMILYNNY